MKEVMNNLADKNRLINQHDLFHRFPSADVINE